MHHRPARFPTRGAHALDLLLFVEVGLKSLVSKDRFVMKGGVIEKQ